MIKYLWPVLFCTIFSCKSDQSNQNTPSNLLSVKVDENAAPEVLSESITKFVQKKRKQGVNFYAFGNEQSWSLDLDFDGVFCFKSLNGININTPATKKEMAQDFPAMRYRAEVESGELIITIIDEECIDQMSGEIFTNRVEVQARNGIDSGYTSFSGCGNYIPDIRLHDIWGLIELEGSSVPNDDFPKGAILELFPDAEKVIGNDGCNDFNGKFENKGDILTFGQLGSTKKSCNENKTGLQLPFSEMSYNYTLKKGILTLSKGPTVVMRWRKID